MKLSRSLVLLAVLALVSACATPFVADVSRFQRLPAPTGESFAIEAKDPARAGGLEFAQYAAYVENQLVRQGYARASSPEQATLLVKLDYGVNDGREKIATRYSGFGYPGFGYSGFGGYGSYGFGYGGPYYGHRFGYRPYFRSAYYGPYWGSGYGGGEVYSYTVFRSFLDMDIVRRSDGSPVFEGRAEANTRFSDLTRLVPNLVEAMFTGFPGSSGQTVRVKLEPDRQG